MEKEIVKNLNRPERAKILDLTEDEPSAKKAKLDDNDFFEPTWMSTIDMS